MKIFAAICSAVVWGGGQVINRQRLKGLVFFLVQCVLLFIELSTGTLDVLRGVSEPAFRSCGFFIKGIWGLITLGRIPRLDSSTLVYDHSIMLLIGGIISAAILLLFAFIWIWNIRDAYGSRAQLERGETISAAKYAKKLWQNSFEYIMIIPGALLVLFIIVIPMLSTMLVAFTNYNANAIPPRNMVDWTGFKTFADFLKLPIWGKTFVGVLTWTVVWAVLSTFTTYVFGMLQAVLINSKGIRLKQMWRGIYILPWAVPALASIIAFRTLLSRDGVINQILLRTGFIAEGISFLGDPNWARASVILVNMWIGFPYFMALISGVMTAISPELYEAAEVDGSSGWHKFRHISLPAILTATAPQIVMYMLAAFNNFGAIYFLTEGRPVNSNYQMAGSTDILISWIFKLTFSNRMYNYAAAVTILIFIVLAIAGGFNIVRTRAYKED